MKRDPLCTIVEFWRRMIYIAFLLILQVGCADTIAEKKKDVYLLREANMNYADNDHFDAEKAYKKILDEYPDSPYRLNAQMGFADSLFRQERYMEASWSYRDFYDFYPTHKDAVKAYFYKGMSSFLDRKTYDRDQTDTEKALEEFEKIVNDPEFSKSVFYEESVKGIKECRKLLALHNFSIGQYYFKTDSLGGAISRMKYLMEEYPGEPYEDEAVYIIAESYYRRDNFTLAMSYYKNIMEKYSHSKYARLAKERLAAIKAAGDRLSAAR